MINLIRPCHHWTPRSFRESTRVCEWSKFASAFPLRSQYREWVVPQFGNDFSLAQAFLGIKESLVSKAPLMGFDVASRFSPQA